MFQSVKPFSKREKVRKSSRKQYSYKALSSSASALQHTGTHTHKLSSVHVPTRANVSQPVAMALHSVALLCLPFSFQSLSTFPLPVSICCYCSRHCCRHYFLLLLLLFSFLLPASHIHTHTHGKSRRSWTLLVCTVHN